MHFGRQIKSFAGLEAAATRRKSVIGKTRGFAVRMPAAFLLSMQARMVHRAIKGGLYIYTPNPA